MHNHLRTFIPGLSLAALIAGLGCGGVAEPTQESDDEISARTAKYVTLTRDMRRCMAPLCGGYFVKDVNAQSQAVYVSGFDFSASNLDQETIGKVQSAPIEDLIIYGRLGPKESRFNTRALRVLEAFRGLPGVTPLASDRFYSVSTNDPPIQCFAAPCNNDLAQLLNRRSAPRAFTGVDVTAAAKRFVDSAWVIGRVERHGALVAAHFAEGQQFPAGRESLLLASQVYVKLPDTTGPCPMFPIARCPEGQVMAMSRTADRCMVPAGCVGPALCPLFIPGCDDGYTLDSWGGLPNACPVFACDPSFILPEPTSLCAAVFCGPGTHCVEDGVEARCEPDVSCANVRCAQGTHCVDTDGPARCEPDASWVSEATSIDSGNPYRNNLRLAFSFTSASPNARSVRVHFSRFDLEADYDFVVIQDLAGNELARYTGRLGDFTSGELPGSAVKILFTTDSSVTASGFAIDHVDSLVQ